MSGVIDGSGAYNIEDLRNTNWKESPRRHGCGHKVLALREFQGA